MNTVRFNTALLVCVLLMQAYTLLAMNRNHAEAIERHASITRTEIEDQKLFNTYVQHMVEHWEKSINPTPTPTPAQ